MSVELDIPRFFELTDLVTPMVVRAAATLRLADHVQDGASTVADLAGRTDCIPRVLSKVVDHLVAVELFEWRPSGELAVTPFGSPLLSGWEDGSLRAFLDLEDVSGRAEMSITGLLHTLHTGRTSYEGLHGQCLWSDVDCGSGTDAGIAGLAPAEPAFDPELVVDSYDWSQWTHVVDVGGNNGGVSAGALSPTSCVPLDKHSSIPSTRTAGCPRQCPRR